MKKENPPELSHIDPQGKAHMVDVGHKPIEQRSATARGFIRLQPMTLRLVRENQLKKGDVLTVAEIAGIQAAKQTSSLIPLCHPLSISQVRLQTEIIDEAHRSGVQVTSRVSCSGQTGVEMEALTAVSLALLTIYDMCKAADKQMRIEDIELLEKTRKPL